MTQDASSKYRREVQKGAKQGKVKFIRTRAYVNSFFCQMLLKARLTKRYPTWPHKRIRFNRILYTNDWPDWQSSYPHLQSLYKAARACEMKHNNVWASSSILLSSELKLLISDMKTTIWIFSNSCVHYLCQSIKFLATLHKKLIVFFIHNCAKTRLRQCRIGKFTGVIPPDSRFKETGRVSVELWGAV